MFHRRVWKGATFGSLGARQLITLVICTSMVGMGVALGLPFLLLGASGTLGISAGRAGTHPWVPPWFLLPYFGLAMCFPLFSCAFLSFFPHGMMVPNQPLMGSLKLGEWLQIFAVLMMVPKRNRLGEEKGVCFGVMRILSPPAGETAGVLSCPGLPALASPVLHPLAAARRREGFAVDLREPTIWFLARSFLGEVSSSV